MVAASAHGSQRPSRQDPPLQAIAAAESGEQVIIARNGKPAVKLVVIPKKTKSRRAMLGAGIGKLWMSPDFHSQGESDEIAKLVDTGHRLE